MILTYLTVITTDEYLEGVLVLNQSLLNVHSKFPLTVLATKKVSNNVKNIIKKNGIELINIPSKINISKEIFNGNIKNGFSHWNDTLDKLYIFELTQFDKIVYLDSDMIVLENIDKLFNYPHMSAVVAGKSYPGNYEWVKLNSGCMVIKPEEGLSHKLIEIIPKVSRKKEFFGDQDIIQEYYNTWEYDKDKILDETYNIFFCYMEYYIKKLEYDLKGNNSIKIVHFTGSEKPWMKSNKLLLKQYVQLITRREYNLAKVLKQYILILWRVRMNN